MGDVPLQGLKLLEGRHLGSANKHVFVG
jgi:hypothetical protein